MSQPFSTRLGDVCVFRKGKKPSITFDEPIAGSLPYLLIESFDGTRENFTNDLSCVLCTEDDTLIVCDGARSGLTSFGHRGYVGSTIAALVPVKAKIFPGFLYHFVKSQYDFLNKSVHGAAVPHIERQLLLGLRFYLPPLDEQERIVHILDEADEMKQLRTQANNRTADLIPALFDELFGNKKIFPKSTIGKVANLITSGITPLGGSDIYVKRGPYFLRSQNVLMNHLDLTDIVCLPEEIHQSMIRTKVQDGDVLLNITGASIGRVTWVEHLDREANVNQHVCLIRPKREQIHPIFLSVFLSSSSAQGVIYSVQAGASRQALNHEQVREFEIPLPPLALQEEFAAIVEEIRALSLDQSVAGPKLESLFQSLLHHAFEGEL